MPDPISDRVKLLIEVMRKLDAAGIRYEMELPYRPQKVMYWQRPDGSWTPITDETDLLPFVNEMVEDMKTKHPELRDRLIKLQEKYQP